MTKEITDRIDALGEGIDYSDPSTYTSVLGYDEGGVADEPPPSGYMGETDVAAPGTQVTQPAPAVAAAPAPAPTPESSATPAAAESGDATSEAVDGIATRDGKRIIPYAVLESERRNNIALKQQLAKANEQLQAMAAAAPGTGESDLAAKAQAAPDSLTDAEMEELARDFPALVKPLNVIRQMSAKLAQPAPHPAAPAPAPAPAQASAQHSEDNLLSEQEAFDRGIADNPVLAGWMSQGGREWDRAVALDGVLGKDPAYAGLTYSQRFEKVQRMVAAEFDIALPAPKQAATKAAATPAAAPAPAPAQQPAAPIEAMPTLTDLGGTGVSHDANSFGSMTTGQMVDKAMSMTDEQLRQMAGIPY